VNNQSAFVTQYQGQGKRMAKNWIAGAIRHPGALRRSATAAGMSTHAFAEKHKHDSGKTGNRARLALTLGKMNKGKKK
jgi:hypothetical protein